MPSGGLEVLLKAERGEIDPLTITADQYDLVCNGVELSSGAVRNHDPEIMVKAFELVRLGEEDVKKKFPAMYNAFCYGAPPHAGIAPGVDRMVMLLAGESSIREIIPFPMNKNAQDIMIFRNYKTQDRPGPAFLFHLLHQKLQKFQLVAGEPPQALIQPLQPHRVGKLHREKLLRRDLQIVANVEEHGHGRQIHAVFDVVDIPGALPQRKAHVPGRHPLGLPQL